MNFKPTLWKSMISVIVFVIFDSWLSYFSAFVIFCVTYLGMGFARCPTFVEYITSPGFLLVSLVLAVLTYVIWSLFQRKKKK